ncbi:MAG: CheR family methyltransferase [Desulfobacterales bacterium]|jgi:chemotaxis methyl-accepting protein methylase
MHDDQFRQLLDRLNLAWSGYRKVRKGVKKRISRHMQETNCSGMQAYLDLIAQNDTVRQECELRITVSISRFFRDRQLWVGLEQDILPGIIKPPCEKLCVWSAGCARGEEVYSLKMIWDRLRPTCAQLPMLEITGTDKHPNYIEKARAGVYTLSSLKEVPPEMREYYFDIRKSNHRFDVKVFMKANIDWKVRDIFNDPPGYGFNIIFMRNNLLTYYQDHLKEEGLSRVAKALAPGGWLIIGSHEKMPPSAVNLRRHPSISWAYQWEG